MISLVVPTYKERENIAKLIQRTGAALVATGEPFELIIVDDNSPDGTADEVRRLQKVYPWLQIIVRLDQKGLSTAVVTGWRAARGDLLGCMDGDLQHPPECLIELVDRLRQGDAEIAIASRYVEQGGVSEWKFHRRIVSWTATLLTKIALPSKIRNVRDPMSGFFVLRRSALEGVDLQPLGYKILLEVLARGRYTRAAEVAYTFEERVEGGSKIGAKQVWQFLIHLLRLRLSLR